MMGLLSNLVSGISGGANPLSQISSLTRSLHNSAAAILPVPGREMAAWAKPSAPMAGLEAFRLPGLPSLPKLPSLPSMPNLPGLQTGAGGLPGLPKLPSLPQLPALPELPKLPGLPQLPGLPSLAGGLPQLPKLPELPQLSGLPKLPGLPELPKLPGLPQLPGLPGLSGGALPQLPQMPQLPILPQLPDLPIPPLPQLPGLPSLSGGAASGLPGLPQLPGLPKLPDLPQLPSMPSLPSLPQLPGLPKLPTIGLPNIGFPNLGLPELPQLPSLPELPSLPDLPGLPSLPGLPELPHVPGFPGLPGQANQSLSKFKGPDSITLANMAQDVYKQDAAPPAGWRTADAQDLARIGLRPSDLAPANSPFFARVYTTGEGADKQYVVAFRGSTKDRRDWETNGKQALGMSTPHYTAALSIGRKLAQAGATNVTMTGHSLGGGLASAAALASGRNAQTFNAAGLSDATINQANSIRQNAGAGGPGDIRAYYVRGEILSLLQDGGDRIAGPLLGTILAGPLGGIAGLGMDAPEAYGTRIALDPVRPEGTPWWQGHPISKHGMDWVIASLRN